MKTGRRKNNQNSARHQQLSTGSSIQPPSSRTKFGVEVIPNKKQVTKVTTNEPKSLHRRQKTSQNTNRQKIKGQGDKFNDTSKISLKNKRHQEDSQATLVKFNDENKDISNLRSNLALNEISEQKLNKRQSNSYHKILKTDGSSLNIHLNNSKSDDESSVMDQFFEKKFKHSQQQYMNAKSKLYEKECIVENLQSELRKQKRENKLIQEKVHHLESELGSQTKKSVKYKQIAKQFKANLDHIERTLSQIKSMSQEEISKLKSSNKFLEKIVQQRSFQYQTNMRTIETYLLRIQKMMTPSDQNYSFNIKVMSDLTELCQQLQKMSKDEEQQLKQSMISHNQMLNDDKSNIEMEFLLSQSSHANNDEQILSQKTKRLLDDYERLRFESDHIKKENLKLKERVESTDKIKMIHTLSTYDSKESIQKRNQSLSVGDLTQYDSVQKLNNKLEEKNKNLEGQIQSMQQQMSILAVQTREMQNERQQFKHQIQRQHEYILSIMGQNISNQTYERGSISKESDQQQRYSEEVFTTNQSDSYYYQGKENADDKKTQKLNERDSLDRNSGFKNIKTIKNYNPYSLSPVSSQKSESHNTRYHEKNQTLLERTKSLAHVSFQQKNLNELPSQSTSNMVSSRDENQLNTDRQSKEEYSNSTEIRKQNVFRRNRIMDSDKENQDSYRNNQSNLASYRNEIQPKTFNYQEDDKAKIISKKTQHAKRPPSNTSHILSTTSPSMFNNVPSHREVSAQNMLKNNTRVSSVQNLRKPTSLGSTTTLIINEKAKALKDEITTLDDEIQQLQKNLKRAISKREPRDS
ncbi:UNKNOWN [Stylonychia lemnae]|uniref:Uncharacterized protein n=1 Tax=Stylonychia lemnae TaxID=5949 RepID=A0A078A7N8_STYLE|nr:UNKNOWN [Stylonychia lemnae]|eukprot:CDW78270.1 UNKNOWN [Stylonychia lemnae]